MTVALYQQMHIQGKVTVAEEIREDIKILVILTRNSQDPKTKDITIIIRMTLPPDKILVMNTDRLKMHISQLSRRDKGARALEEETTPTSIHKIEEIDHLVHTHMIVQRRRL